MALYDTTAGFTNAFNGAQNVTDTFRKNMAFKALEKTYGPIVGDMKLATDVQSYEQNKLLNPLEVEGKQLTNAGLAETNAFNKANRPLVLESNTIANKTAAFNQTQAETEAERTARLRKAADVHTTLGTVLSTVETSLNGVEDPNQRLAIFDQQVTQFAPLIGAEPDALLKSLAQQRAAVAAQGTAAIGPMRKQLDDMLNAQMTPADRQALAKGETDIELQRAKIITEGQQAEKATAEADAAKAKAAGEVSSTADGIDMAVDQLERTTAGINELNKLVDKMDKVGLSRKAKALVPGTAEYNFVQQGQNAAVEGGLQALQALDAAGVSLAPMSDTDFRALITSVANLDVGQDKAQLKRQINNLAEQTKRALYILKTKKAALPVEKVSGEVATEDVDGETVVDFTDYFQVQ